MSNLPHKIWAVEWYHDRTSDGQRTHCSAEDPRPPPAILCESEEQADELLAIHAGMEAAKRPPRGPGEAVVRAPRGSCPDCGPRVPLCMRNGKVQCWRCGRTDVTLPADLPLRERILAEATKRGSLPKDVIGAWPGDETDEELLAALKDLDHTSQGK